MKNLLELQISLNVFSQILSTAYNLIDISSKYYSHDLQSSVNLVNEDPAVYFTMRKNYKFCSQNALNFACISHLQKRVLNFQAKLKA